MKVIITLNSQREVIFDEEALLKAVFGTSENIGNKINSVALSVEHEGHELIAYASEESAGCAGIAIDGKTGDELYYLAGVETPGEYCKDSYTARLYAGNPEYEVDGPIALVKTKADYKPEYESLTKIVYIDRDVAAAVPWKDVTENLSEHLEG